MSHRRQVVDVLSVLMLSWSAAAPAGAAPVLPKKRCGTSQKHSSATKKTNKKASGTPGRCGR